MSGEYPTMPDSTLDGVETLTNKTLASPTITGTATLTADVATGTAVRTVTGTIANGAAAGVIIVKASNNLSNASAYLQKWVNNNTTDIARVDAFEGNGGRFRVLTNSGYFTAPTSTLMGLDALTAYVEVTGSQVRLVNSSGQVLFLSTNVTPSSAGALRLGTSALPWGRISLGGTAHVAGDYALSSGWGDTATVGTISGSDPHSRFTVTCGGSGIGANPTITLTYKDGTWTVAPFAVVRFEDASTPAELTTAVTQTTTATTLVITLRGTPTTGRTYTFQQATTG